VRSRPDEGHTVDTRGGHKSLGSKNPMQRDEGKGGKKGIQETLFPLRTDTTWRKKTGGLTNRRNGDQEKTKQQKKRRGKERKGETVGSSIFPK